MNTILLIHPSPLFRAGLRAVLEPIGMQIVGEASDALHALEVARFEQPEMALLDASLPCCDPFELMTQLFKQGCHVVVFAPRDEELLFEYMRHGAVGYELPTITSAELAAKIQRVAAGEYVISMFAPVIWKGESSPQPDYSPDCSKALLTPAEMAVLKQVLLGRSTKEAGRSLGCSDQTVKNHLTSILKKLGVHNRTHAVVVALGRGILSLEDIPAHHHLVLSPEAFAARGWKERRVS